MNSVVTRRAVAFSVVSLCILATTACLRGEYPKPSAYPISWELTFDHKAPKRFIMQPPGEDAPVAIWYMTYHVVNNTDRDKVTFFPTFEMMTPDGSVVRSDRNISPAVFDAIRAREKNKYLQDAHHIGGDLLQGEDQSKDGVAIWIEPKERMGTFTIFAAGFWGESATVKVGDKDVPVRKTMQLTYQVNGDNDAVTGDGDSQFIMR